MSKKSFLLIVLGMIFLSCQTDKRVPFTIVGDVKNLNGTEVSLQQFGIVYDVATIENDQFSLSGNLISMEMCEVLFKGDGYRGKSGKIMRWARDLPIFVENGASYKLIANSEKDVLESNYQVQSNGAHQKIWSAYLHQVQQEKRLLAAKLQDFEAKSTAALKLNENHLYSSYLDSIRVYEDQLPRLTYKVYRKLMNQNPNTYASIYIASTAPDIAYDLPFYEGIYNRLDQEFKDHHYGKTLQKKLAEATKHKENELTKK